MLEIQTGWPDRVLAVTARERVTGEDYQSILIPALEDRLRRHEKIDLLYHLGEEFTRFTTTALWDDTRLGLQHLHDFDRVAIVTDVTWIRSMAAAASRVLDAEIRVYGNAELGEAGAWLRQAP